MSPLSETPLVSNSLQNDIICCVIECVLNIMGCIMYIVHWNSAKSCITSLVAKHEV